MGCSAALAEGVGLFYQPASAGKTDPAAHAGLRATSWNGQVAEWSIAHAWKACVGESLPRVRIPLCPPRPCPTPLTPPDLREAAESRAVFAPGPHRCAQQSAKSGRLPPNRDASLWPSRAIPGLPRPWSHLFSGFSARSSACRRRDKSPQTPTARAFSAGMLSSRFINQQAEIRSCFDDYQDLQLDISGPETWIIRASF